MSSLNIPTTSAATNASQKRKRDDVPQSQYRYIWKPLVAKVSPDRWELLMSHGQGADIRTFSGPDIFPGSKAADECIARYRATEHEFSMRLRILPHDAWKGSDYSRLNYEEGFTETRWDRPQKKSCVSSEGRGIIDLTNGHSTCGKIEDRLKAEAKSAQSVHTKFDFQSALEKDSRLRDLNLSTLVTKLDIVLMRLKCCVAAGPGLDTQNYADNNQADGSSATYVPSSVKQEQPLSHENTTSAVANDRPSTAKEVEIPGSRVSPPLEVSSIAPAEQLIKEVMTLLEKYYKAYDEQWRDIGNCIKKERRENASQAALEKLRKTMADEYNSCHDWFSGALDFWTDFAFLLKDKLELKIKSAADLERQHTKDTTQITQYKAIVTRLERQVKNSEKLQDTLHKQITATKRAKQQDSAAARTRISTAEQKTKLLEKQVADLKAAQRPAPTAMHLRAQAAEAKNKELEKRIAEVHAVRAKDASALAAAKFRVHELERQISGSTAVQSKSLSGTISNPQSAEEKIKALEKQIADLHNARHFDSLALSGAANRNLELEKQISHWQYHDRVKEAGACFKIQTLERQLAEVQHNARLPVAAIPAAAPSQLMGPSPSLVTKPT